MVDLASIRNASFSLTPTGYNPEQVDRFLGELADGAVADIDLSELRNASFSLTPTGYNPEEVDQFLGSIADQLAADPAPQVAQNEPPSFEQPEQADELEQPAVEAEQP
ncbi:MAG: DivIVA protein, partial [Gaiellales bacterium]|nr:DivIVA protein [Gaiellales bacterium]